jgi:LysM repeat protein
MRTRFLIAALAVLLGAGFFVAAPARDASASYGAVHCMSYGQTLSGVAAMYGSSAWAIAKYNGIANPNYVQAGTCVRIPPPGWGAYQVGYYGGYPAGHHPGPHHGYKQPYHGGYGQAYNGYYCVRFGDTLYSIGARFGVSAWSIAYANGLANPNYIRAGTWLRIPAY